MSKAAEKPVLWQVLHVASAVCVQSARDAVASHQTAAVIHGISLLNRPEAGIVRLTRPPGRYRGSGVPGVRFHSAALPPAHVVTRYGVPLTTGARTVVDLARSLPYLEAVAVADSALHARITTKAELRRMLADCAGWPRIGAARRVVEFSDELAESVLESAARVVFAQAGLPPPRGAVQRLGRVIARIRKAFDAPGSYRQPDPGIAVGPWAGSQLSAGRWRCDTTGVRGLVPR
jgi:hypothetical protein